MNLHKCMSSQYYIKVMHAFSTLRWSRKSKNLIMMKLPLACLIVRNLFDSIWISSSNIGLGMDFLRTLMLNPTWESRRIYHWEFVQYNPKICNIMSLDLVKMWIDWNIQAKLKQNSVVRWYVNMRSVKYRKCEASAESVSSDHELHYTMSNILDIYAWLKFVALWFIDGYCDVLQSFVSIRWYPRAL